jgi:hypothetical protein
MEYPGVKRLEERFRRSKQSGKVVLGAVLLVSSILFLVVFHGVTVAWQAQRWEVVIRGGLGLLLLVALDLFSIVLIRRQHRVLDEVRAEMLALVTAPEKDRDRAASNPPPQPRPSPGPTCQRDD